MNYQYITVFEIVVVSEHDPDGYEYFEPMSDGVDDGAYDDEYHIDVAKALMSIVESCRGNCYFDSFLVNTYGKIMASIVSGSSFYNSDFKSSFTMNLDDYEMVKYDGEIDNSYHAGTRITMTSVFY